MKHVVSTFAACAALMTASAAFAGGDLGRAFDGEEDDLGREFGVDAAAGETHNHAGVHLGIGSATGIDGLTIFTQRFDLQVGLNPNVGFRAQWVGLFVDGGESSPFSTFEIGNLLLGVDLALVRTPTLRLSVQPSFTLPLANLDDDDPGSASEAAIAYGAALGMHGLRDLWLFLPETATIVLPLVVEAEAGLLRVEGELTVAVFIPTEDTDRRDVELELQPGLRLGVAAGPVVVGVGVVGVALVSSDAGDAFQLSMDPFVRVELPLAEIELSLLMNLDDPVGWSFDDGGFFGVFIGANFLW